MNEYFLHLQNFLVDVNWSCHIFDLRPVKKKFDCPPHPPSKKICVYIYIHKYEMHHFTGCQVKSYQNNKTLFILILSFIHISPFGQVSFILFREKFYLHINILGEKAAFCLNSFDRQSSFIHFSSSTQTFKPLGSLFPSKTSQQREEEKHVKSSEHQALLDCHSASSGAANPGVSKKIFLCCHFFPPNDCWVKAN